MPILMKDISIDIPKKAEDNVPQDLLPTDQIVVELARDGRLKMSGVEVNRVELAEKLREKLDRKRDKVVFVDIDDTVRYGDAVGIMDTCKGAGATTVALKTKEDRPPGLPPAGQPGGVPPDPTSPPPAPAPPATP
jgi:biopolymer transport protein ExbD